MTERKALPHQVVFYAASRSLNSNHTPPERCLGLKVRSLFGTGQTVEENSELLGLLGFLEVVQILFHTAHTDSQKRTSLSVLCIGSTLA